MLLPLDKIIQTIAEYPYVFTGYEHWKKYYSSDLFQELAQEYTNHSGGNQIVGQVYFGSRHLTANKAVIHSNDAKGLKIRVPNAPAYIMFPKSIGANATPMAYSEVYLALQQKVVDGLENPLVPIRVNNSVG